MAAARRALRTADEIRAAGAAAVADWPPLSDQQVNEVVAILASNVADLATTTPRPAKADAA